MNVFLIADLFVSVAMSDRPPDPTLTVQRGTEQGMSHTDQQIQVFPSHLRPLQDLTESQ